MSETFAHEPLDYDPQIVGASRPQRFGDVAKLAAALAKAQGQIDDASKDSVNPHFKNRYADLASVRAAIRRPLSENGIAYVQLPRSTEKSVEVETILIHAESGQSIGETLRMPLQQQTPQAVGSALSYARRYALMSIVGLAADDDDGEAASKPNGARKPANGDDGGFITPAQAEQLRAAAEETETDLRAFCEYLKIPAIPSLPAARYDEAMKALAMKRAKKARA